MDRNDLIEIWQENHWTIFDILYSAYLKKIENDRLHNFLIIPIFSDQIDISVRCANALKFFFRVDKNILDPKISDLVICNAGELLRSKDFGRRSYKEIVTLLEGMGLGLSMNLPKKYYRNKGE